MRIVVNTPAGNIGRVVVRSLLRAKHEVVIISRHPEKVAEAVRGGATLVQGSMEDASVLERALQGADALFWLTPIVFDQADYMAWARRVGRVAAEAAKRRSVPRAVLISSIGAQHEKGVGPIGCMPAIEQAFEKAVPDVTVLRPGSFMENHLMNVASIAQSGRIFGRYPASRRIPLIATRDIAEKATSALTRPAERGFRMLELQGPVDLDQEQAAAIIAEGIGRPVKYVEVTAEQGKQGMISAGVSAAFADLLSEMYDGLHAGLMVPTQPRSAATTTPTTLLQFSREVLKPAVDAAAPPV